MGGWMVYAMPPVAVLSQNIAVWIPASANYPAALDKAAGEP